MSFHKSYIVDKRCVGIKHDLGLLDVNFDELKDRASMYEDPTLVIMQGNSVKFMRELVGNDFEVVFGRQVEGSDVVFERGQGDSVYPHTSRRHTTLRVDMTLPSRPVFELRDVFSLNPTDERENALKATRVYREDGQLRASLIHPQRIANVESGDIIHFVPLLTHTSGGDHNLEFVYTMFVWMPNFDAKIPKFEVSQRCPLGSTLDLYKHGVWVGQIADHRVLGETTVLFGHGEDVSAYAPDCHTVVLEIGQARTRHRSKFRPHSILKVVVDAALGIEVITVQDVFDDVDPSLLQARCTAVYTRNGVLRAQLNATQRSARVFESDVLVFENNSDFSYALVVRDAY